MNFDAKYRLSLLTKLSNWLKKMVGLFRERVSPEIAAERKEIKETAMCLDACIAVR